MASRSGIFAECPQLAPTAIFHLTARFKADKHPKKLNLGVGAYRNEALQPVVFSAVRKAEAAVVAAHHDKEYLPVTGLPEFNAAAARLVFGSDGKALDEKRIASCQTLSGTGALTVAAHAVRRLLPGRTVYCSDPTWENHNKIIADCGLGTLMAYRWYDAATCGLDWAGLVADLEAMPEGSVVMLHACAHNPTGVDPTREQWMEIASIMKRRALVPWFDSAYQGFASGNPEEDAWAVRYFVSSGHEMFVCQSFAKNFGLYAERTGCLHIVAAESTSAAAVSSVLESIVRPMYSNPPAHGARVVAKVLGDAELKAEWLAELADAMARVHRMRALLRAAVEARGTPGSWGHITAQIGMFSYTGLTPAQCERMVEEFHVYMLGNSRINVAGLNEATVPVLADAIDAVVRGLPAPQ